MDTFSSQPRISFFQPASAQNHRSHTAPSAWTDLGDTASLSLEYNPRVHGRQDDTPFNELSLNSLTIHEPEHDAFPQYYRQEELIDAERVIRWGAGKTFNTSTGAVFPAPHLNRYPSHDDFGIDPTLTVTAPADGLSSGLGDDTLGDGPAPLQKIDSFDPSDDEDFPPDTPALDEGRSPPMADSQDELDALEDDGDIWMPPLSRKVANIPRRAMTPATFRGAVDTLRTSRPRPQSPIERLARYLPTPDPSSDSSDDDEYTNSRPHKRKAHFTRKQSVKRPRTTHIETVVPSPSRLSIRESSLPATTGHRDQPPEHPDVGNIQKNANRKFVCPYEGCSQETSSRGDLRRHFQTAKHRERSFFCTKCSKGFTREDALLRHLRRRTCKPPVVSVKDSAGYV